MLEHLVLRTSAAHAFTVLAPYEQKGFELVGLKTRGGGAVIALRAPASGSGGAQGERLGRSSSRRRRSSMRVCGRT